MKNLIEIIKEVENNSTHDNERYIPFALRNEEECQRVKNIIVPQLDRIEKEVVHSLTASIKNCKTLESAQEYFDVLQAIQEIVGGLFFSDEIEVSTRMEQFIRECDRLDDPWLRQHLFEKIKQGTYSLK